MLSINRKKGLHVPARRLLDEDHVGHERETFADHQSLATYREQTSCHTFELKL
jgi:hypothetical protein